MKEHSGIFVQRAVIWVRSAESEFGEIWRKAGDRGAVVSAAEDIDCILTDSAHVIGIGLPGGFKSINFRPLRVLFEVLENERVVRVLAVKRIDYNCKGSPAN